jgi:serine protease
MFFRTLRFLAAVSVASAFADPGAAQASERAEDRLIVKFVDDALVRLRDASLVSEGGFDLTELDLLLTRHQRPAIARLFADELAVDARLALASTRSGRPLPDLNAYFELLVAPQCRDDLLDALKRLRVVETVYRPAVSPPPPHDMPPQTPDGEPLLLYLDPAPTGIDAEWAWTRPGGRGEGVRIADIEYSWRVTHEDLDTTVGTYACFTPGTADIEHGTAVLGELVAGRNGYGVTGIANAASVILVTDDPADMSYSVARAVSCAVGLLDPGDVILIEAQTYGPRDRDSDGTNDFVPVEWDAAEFDAISVATAAGIVVVEPAGNGAEDLDDPVFVNAFDRTTRDSGAIVVGASSTTYGPGPDLSRIDFSTYGSRLDIQGWGDDVGTTGYGDYFDGGDDPDQFYTAVFSGTSAASPMGAAAAAAIQGVQMMCGGPPLSPAAVRTLLVDTGTPQTTGPYPGHIGPRPNLRAALARVDVDDDTDGFKECQGDCDDVRAATYPGAAESNDGLDNQCPGERGYGIVDETSGDSGFHNATDKTEYSWPAQAGATLYRVVRSSRRDFLSGCVGWNVGTNTLNDAAVPTPSGVYYYLNRPIAPHVGSWGVNSGGAERTGVCP